MGPWPCAVLENLSARTLQCVITDESIDIIIAHHNKILFKLWRLLDPGCLPRGADTIYACIYVRCTTCTYRHTDGEFLKYTWFPV